MSTPTTNDETPKRRTWRQRRAEKFEALEAYIEDRETVRDQKAIEAAQRVAEAKREPMDWTFIAEGSHLKRHVMIKDKQFEVSIVRLDTNYHSSMGTKIILELNEIVPPSYWDRHFSALSGTINKPSVAPIITRIC